MDIFFRGKNRHSEILVREKIFRPPKLGARSPPLLGPTLHWLTGLRLYSYTFVRLSKTGLLHVPLKFCSHLHDAEPGLLRGWPFNYGIVSHWLFGHFQEYSPRNSFSNLKQHYLAALGFGALLSSLVPLEEALYKCLQWMNAWMNWYFIVEIKLAKNLCL